MSRRKLRWLVQNAAVYLSKSAKIYCVKKHDASLIPSGSRGRPRAESVWCRCLGWQSWLLAISSRTRYLSYGIGHLHRGRKIRLETAPEAGRAQLEPILGLQSCNGLIEASAKLRSGHEFCCPSQWMLNCDLTSFQSPLTPVQETEATIQHWFCKSSDIMSNSWI